MFEDSKIAIVGATGLVGSHILKIMGEEKLIPNELGLFASQRSRGRIINFNGVNYRVQTLSPDAIRGFDLAFFAAGSVVSSQWAPVFAELGTIVIDKSSAWRADPNCPLVVPQVNGHKLGSIPKGIVSSPNCSTIGFVLAIKPVIDAFGIPKHIFVATYQSVSGAGYQAIENLREQRISREISPFGFFDNVIPGIGAIDDDGFFLEETKLIYESRRILGIEDLLLSVTAVRVPIEVGHSETITAVFDKPVDIDLAARALDNAPCVEFIQNGFPTPVKATGIDNVLVGRLRLNPDNPLYLNLFISFDNLRRGAATNALDIAIECFENMD